MSSTTRPPTTSSTNAPPTSDRTYFEQQREILLKEIGVSFEHVLANINKLNRSLEAVTTVGNEFSSVEALWSQFENVMGKDGEGGKGNANAEGAGEAANDESRGEEYGGDETTVLTEKGNGR